VHEAINTDRSALSSSEREERARTGADRRGPPASERGHARGGGGGFAGPPWAERPVERESGLLFLFLLFSEFHQTKG
jgi:hypothetical protein